MIETVVIDHGDVAADFQSELRWCLVGSLTGPAEDTRHLLFKSGLDQRTAVIAYSPDEFVSSPLTALDHRVSVVEFLGAWALVFEPDSGVLRHVTLLAVPCALFNNNEPTLDACLTGPPAIPLGWIYR